MPAIFDTTLLELLKTAEDVFWAGAKPPFTWMECSERLFDPRSDYRLPSHFHQRFQLVYLVERDLSTMKAWPLVLDEALRLLAPGGLLIFRISEFHFFSIFELKNLLATWGNLVMHFEHHYHGHTIQFAVRNISETRRTASCAGLSFGVITDGRRPKQLEGFIRSVQALRNEGATPIELLVCGPAEIKSQLHTIDEQINLIPEPEDHKNHGWITRKKNLIVSAATHQNLVVTHDRYLIRPDFVRRLEDFGGDFSVLVCRQVDPHGNRIPDWVTLGSDWSWTAPAMLDYGDWTRHAYVNGGIVIAKTEVLKGVKWNELLFWNQAEDVELSRRLRSHGVVPRLARNIIVESAVVRTGFVEGFERIPIDWNRYLLPGPPHASREFTHPALEFDRSVAFGLGKAMVERNASVYLGEEWRAKRSCVLLDEDKWGEVVFRLPKVPRGDVQLFLEIKAIVDQLEVTANGIDTAIQRRSGRTVCVDVPGKAFAFNPILRLRIRSASGRARMYSLTVARRKKSTILKRLRKAVKKRIAAIGLPSGGSQ